MSFAELHAKTYYSFLQAASSPAQMVESAYEKGLKCLGIADFCGLYGVMEFIEACEEKGIIPVIGSELLLENEDRIILLAENESGYKNLCRLITLARLRAKKGKACTFISDLESHSQDLICVMGAKEGKFLTSLKRDCFTWAEQHFLKMIALFKDSLVLVKTLHRERNEKLSLEYMESLSRKYSIRTIVSNQPRFHEKSYGKLLDVLLCIKERTVLAESDEILPVNHEQYIKSACELQELFPKDDLNCAWELVKGFKPVISPDKKHFPVYPGIPEEKSHKVLTRICNIAKKNRYGSENKTVDALLKKELDLIQRKHLSGYFLVVWDIARQARKENIFYHGRGSAANSVVAYLLDIMPVDPVANHLFFERFLNEKTVKAPDMDLDIASGTSDSDREKLIQYVYFRYGEDRVAMACTFIRFRSRSSIREVGRVFGIAKEKIAYFSQNSFSSRLGKVLDELEEDEEIKKLQNSPVWRQFFWVLQKIEGIPRHLSQHSGGMVITREPLCETVPLEPARMEGRVVCQWDKNSLEDAGLAKVDLLGLRMLSVLQESILSLQKKGITFTRKEIEEDPAVYKMIQSGDSVGCFQIESRAQMQILPRTKPSTLNELAVQVAIVRPGPLQGKMVNPYIQAKKSGVAPEIHPLLRSILNETLGVILYQEQVIQVAVKASGFSAEDAEQLRRTMSRKTTRKLEHMRTRFINGAAERGFDHEEATRLFDCLSGFAMYGFCKSHALAFAQTAYQSAWLKYYYPAIYFSAVLNHQPMGFYPASVLIQQCMKQGVKIFPVDVRYSTYECKENKGALILGFNQLKGIERAVSERILNARERREFSSFEDFYERSGLSGAVIRKLIFSGALDNFSSTRSKLLFVLKLCEAGYTSKKTPQLKKESKEELLLMEWQNQGYSLALESDLIKNLSHRYGCKSAEECKSISHGAIIMVTGRIVSRQTPPTAKGFGFLGIQDHTGLLNITISPTLLKKQMKLFRQEVFLLCRGVLQRVDGVENIKAISLMKCS